MDQMIQCLDNYSTHGIPRLPYLVNFDGDAAEEEGKLVWWRNPWPLAALPNQQEEGKLVWWRNPWLLAAISSEISALGGGVSSLIRREEIVDS